MSPEEQALRYVRQQREMTADQLRAAAALERDAAAVWHDKARRAFRWCAGAAVANLVVLVLQLALGWQR